MIKVEVENLYKIFGKQPEKAIKLLEEGKSKEEILEKTSQVVGLMDVSFSIYDREIFVVMGLSGSGKSTLIRCLNRLIEPTSGDIKIDGKSIMKVPHNELLETRRKKMAMVFQSFALLPHLTVVENAAYGLKIQGVSKEERLKKAKQALETVGLKGWEDSYPQQLSGGMQQRVGLARALANDTDILLMDEAFSALDPLIRGDMQDELMELQSKMNKTIIFITHDLDEALKLGDRIALMKDGKIVQIGTPEEILQTPATRYVERFVENVDRTKVLTAENIMIKPKPVVYLKDGPRVALHKMKENGISSIFVVNQSKEIQGLLMAEKAAEAIKAGSDTLEAYLESNYTKVPPDMIVSDIFELMSEGRPIAVASEKNRLLGIIVRGAILQGLAGGGNWNE
ncbi:glycine betaine/proline transport system ATP-binding protein [Anaerovirgula multivorans]|uniref:Quaternary amine transport ATP-binding protein n=1 Tax=Anaerovirgula multivorans TaxID=312168 RepID=A0A239BT98_9FIRM|nr:glycine betaine/L-proline ABC transporter ATP-binding protein [Anaerovirgula multivorans]SNS11126.1 glycine betaine/proline transport system ATP-binding protein [Anaerovirgula multivorans]